jgi:hypothetical protein
MTIWDSIWACCAPSRAEQQAAEALLAEYEQQGHLRKTCREMLSYSNGVIAHFYRQLGYASSTESPVKDEPDSSWMAQSDFCFINVRATGLNDDEMGTFIHAAKLLPALRVNAIHLAPFTDYDFFTIYAVRTLQNIAPRIVDDDLVAQGVSAEDQLRAFVEAAHLLGKTVGFDLEPHVAQYAIPVIMYPEMFRWIKLSPDKNTLADGISNDAMLREEHQQRITGEIRALVESALRDNGLDDLEAAESDDPDSRAAKQELYFNLIGVLIDGGYWTVPSQHWACEGVPAFNGYNHEYNYAQFLYLDPSGKDQSASAFHILTPFKFYSGMRTNRPPQNPTLLPDVADYFNQIFLYWRDTFDFDFVRYDSADHIFDSVRGGEPVSDRPTPDMLRDCIAASRSGGKPYIGNFAERMGNEAHEYAALDYDLILGTDMQERIDFGWAEKTFWLHDELVTLNQDRSMPFSIALCIDTHDTGNPFFWGEPLVKVSGFERMRLRHFVARFASAGLAYRPKYEAMGTQDLSYGLYESNISDKNLVWVGDPIFNRHYHTLENVYEEVKHLLLDGAIIRRHAEDGSAWWVIRHDEALVVAAASLVVDGAHEARDMGIDLEGLLAPGQSYPMTEYDFNSEKPKSCWLDKTQIQIDNLPYLSFRLFVIDLG